MRKLYDLHPFSFSEDFQLKFYRVGQRIFYLRRKCSQNSWWCHKVGIYV